MANQGRKARALGQIDGGENHSIPDVQGYGGHQQFCGRGRT